MAYRKGMGKGKGSGWKNMRYDDSKRHSLASKGIKTAQKIPKMPMGNLPEFVNAKMLTESQVNLLKRRLNDGKIKPHEIFGDGEKTFRLTPEQDEKGVEWLRNLWKTPSGNERENSPFGFREKDVLDKFDHFEVMDFFNNNTFQQQQAGINNYVPLYKVVGKDGGTFEYYVDFRSPSKIAIVG